MEELVVCALRILHPLEFPDTVQCQEIRRSLQRIGRRICLGCICSRSQGDIQRACFQAVYTGYFHIVPLLQCLGVGNLTANKRSQQTNGLSSCPVFHCCDDFLCVYIKYYDFSFLKYRCKYSVFSLYNKRFSSLKMIFPGYMKPKGQIEAGILSLWKSKYEKTVRKDGDR